jgi:hypothetical protein
LQHCSSTCVLVFLVVSFILAFAPVSYMHSTSTPFLLHDLPISSSLTWSFYLYSGKNTSYEALYYAELYSLKII